MSSIFACDLGLNRKTLSRNFFCCFVFRFQEIFFNQHWRQMRASLILLFGKTKAFFGKDTARKKTAFLHTSFVENERETSKLKWGAMFFYKVEGHRPKLSSFGRGKKFRPKKSLTSLLHAALQLLKWTHPDPTKIFSHKHEQNSDWSHVNTWHVCLKSHWSEFVLVSCNLFILSEQCHVNFIILAWVHTSFM